MIQVAPPASQIGRQEATAWQMGGGYGSTLTKGLHSVELRNKGQYMMGGDRHPNVMWWYISHTNHAFNMAHHSCPIYTHHTFSGRERIKTRQKHALVKHAITTKHVMIGHQN